MSFTLRTNDDDEKAIEVAKKFVNSKKKQEVVLDCVRLVPTLMEDIKTLEREVYRLQQTEAKLDRFKKLFKELVT